MPIYDRSYNAVPSERYHVPRLQLDVMNRSRHRHDYVTPRRARTDRNDYYYRHPQHREFIREELLSTRDTTFGFDRDFVHDYYFDNVGGVPGARVQLYTHDSSDPYSCTCYPRASNKTIPSMMYDQVRCPHPQHKYQPAEQDVFAYPWTTQTFRPNVVIQHGYKQGQVKPPSALTAPPFVLYTAKDHNPSKGSKPPPYSAPEKPTLAPLMSAKPSDRRLRRVNRRQIAALPALAPVNEEVSPFDSVSQVAPLRSRIRPPSLRLRTVDSPVMRGLESELRADWGRRALSTPRALPVRDNDGFPETPNRIFKGEYVDTRGQKYKYDIQYGKNTLAGKRSRLRTI